MCLSGCSSVDLGPPPQQPEVRTDDGLLIEANGRRRSLRPEDLRYTGVGQYRWPNGQRYAGAFKDGQPDGLGRLILPDGSRYRGDFSAGQYAGQGRLDHPDGRFYQGFWRDGQRAGEGTGTVTSGVYRGSWRNDQPHGEGVLEGSDGSRYRGSFIDGQRHGSGTLTRQDGSRYEGDWLTDAPNGFGVLRTSNGGRREGQWQNGLSEGYGTFEHPAGLRYEGHWHNDLRHGYGEESRPDGSRYAGEWHEGLPEGEGRMVYADGRSHSGQWRAGRPAGFGLRRHPAGYLLSGEWEDEQISRGELKLSAKPGTRPKAATIDPAAAGTPLDNERYEGDLFTKELALAAPLERWLEAAFEQSANGAAAYLLAVRGSGTDGQRREWLKRAATAGVAAAQLALGRGLLDTDLATALEWLRRAGSHRDQPLPAAHLLLGQLYHVDPRLPQDEDQAEDHYLRAAALGSIDARLNLALMLATTSIEYLNDPQRALATLAPIATFYRSPDLLGALAVIYDAAGEAKAAAALRAELNLKGTDSAQDSEQERGQP